MLGYRLTVQGLSYRRVYHAATVPFRLILWSVRCWIFRTRNHARHEAESNGQATALPDQVGSLLRPRREYACDGRDVGSRLSNAPSPSITALAKPLQYAVVVGAVAAGQINVAEGNGLVGGSWVVSERIANSYNSPGKSRDVMRGTGKDIVIANPSPQVEKFFPLLNIENVKWGNRSSWTLGSYAAVNTGFRSDESVPCMRRIMPELEIARERRISEFAFSAHCHATGWRLPAILPRWTKPPVIKSGLLVQLPETAQTLRKYKSPFVCGQCFSGKFRLSAGGDPKSPRECSNDNGRQGCDGRSGIIQIAASAFNVTVNRGTEDGWTFFGGAAAFISLLSGYALFECWRKRAFRKYKNGNQADKNR